MLHDKMDIYLLRVHAQQVEVSSIKRNNRELKRERPYNGGTSKGKFNIQDKPKFKKIFSNHVPSSFPKANKDRISNPKPQGGNVCGSSSESPNFQMLQEALT